jgi:hypothetical protein
MPSLDPVCFLWCLAIVQVLALASACLARLFEGSLREGRFQWFCLGCLTLAGVATMASLLVGPTTCLFSGVALSVTILTATWDLGTALL